MADNPFNALLDPSKQGTITGFIGGLMGNPTADQAAGSATGRALQELTALRDQGLSPQQALVKYLQTPGGIDYFSNAGPNGLKNLTDALSATTPPAPMIHNVPEGGALIGTNPQTGQPTTLFQNPKTYAPTTLGPQDIAIDRNGNKIAENTNQKAGETPADVRSFQYFTQIAKLPPEEIQRLAAIKVDPSKSSVSSMAIDKLVDDYGLDPRLGEALKAGSVKVLPLKNEYGQDTGDASIVDLTGANGPTVQILSAKGRRTTGADVPNTPMAGTSPSTGAATGVLPPASTATPSPTPSPMSIPEANPKYFGNKMSMFLASGPIAKGLAAASSLSESINPKLIIPEGAQAADRQVLIDTLRSDLAAMGQMGDGWVNKGVLDGYLKLAPSGSMTESPHQSIQKAIRLAEHIRDEIAAQEEVKNDPKQPIEQRKKANSLIEGWRRVQRDMPTYDELVKGEEQIRSGTAGAPTISGAVDTVVRAGSKAITEVKKEAGKVQQDQGLTSEPPLNFDTMELPDLIKVDPAKLDRPSKIKLMRRLDALKRGVNAPGKPR